MEQMVKVEVSEFSGSVGFIHGKAPFQLGDLIGWLQFTIEYLEVIDRLCDLEDVSIAPFQDIVRKAIETPLKYCNDGIEALKESFPEDEDFARFHYKGEGERQQRRQEMEEETQAEEHLLADLKDPLKSAESLRHSISTLIVGLHQDGFDARSMMEDLLVGKPKPVEAYKVNGGNDGEGVKTHGDELQD